jgi:hypothetical protein
MEYGNMDIEEYLNSLSGNVAYLFEKWLTDIFEWALIIKAIQATAKTGWL